MKNIPNISISEFRENQIAGNHEILYNLIEGERIIAKNHKHDFFVIMLFENASGVHEIDFVSYPISNFEVHLLFPDQVHRWKIEENSKAYQLMIDKVLFEHFLPYLRFSMTNYINHPVIKVKKEEFEQLKIEFKAIKKEILDKDSLQEIIYARATVIASIVSKSAEEYFISTKVTQANSRLSEFSNLINLHFKEEKTVAFYASILNISSNYLNILCKKNLSVSALQLIQERVILEAKRLLQSSDLTIKEIAFELGFVDHAYFSNFFKNYTKITPTQFREK